MAAHIHLEVRVKVSTWRLRVLKVWLRFAPWATQRLAAWAARGVQVRR